jgi:hypothetical protein
MQLKAARCLILSGFLALVFSGVGRADLLSGCPTCQGSTYLLQYDPTKTTTSGGVTIYDVFFTIDPSGYTGGGLYIHSVAIKIASQDASTGNSIVDAPGGAGSWSLKLGGLSAKGCDGQGGGFICAQDDVTAPVPPNLSYVTGTEYTWEFHYATSESLFVGPLESSIKAQYVNANGKKVGALVSEEITLQRLEPPPPPPPPPPPVPDGGVTLMLLGGALVGLEILRRRFRA